MRDWARSAERGLEGGLEPLLLLCVLEAVNGL